MERKLAIRILNKLFDAGYCDEKAIKDLSVEEFMTGTKKSVDDIAGLIALQKAIRSRNVISFLAGEERKSLKKVEPDVVIDLHPDDVSIIDIEDESRTSPKESVI